jgi:CheY-like chemotaxis protein
LRRDADVLEAANCDQAKRLVEEHTDLEVILLDLNLPDGDGFRLLAQLREHYPDISIIVLSASNDRDYVVRALDLARLDLFRNRAARRYDRRAGIGALRRHLHSTRKSPFATRCLQTLQRNKFLHPPIVG